MQENLVKVRIIQICILLAVSLFLYQFTQWDHSLWIPISVMAIAGPFLPGLTINKAYQRLYGTTAGLLISIIIMFILRYNHNMICIFAVISIYFVAFSLLKEYKYFIMMVTIIICINYNYMNIPFLYYDQTYFLVTRGVGVFVGICVFLFFEYFIYKNNYTIKIAKASYIKYSKILKETIAKISDLSKQDKALTFEQINQYILLLNTKLTELENLSSSFNHNVKHQSISMHHAEYLQKRYKYAILILYKNSYRLCQDKNFDISHLLSLDSAYTH
ncbi:MAG: FUSC family protein [Rickettsiaceae bacterium]